MQVILFVLFCLSCPIMMAFAEYFIHKYVMHKRFFKSKRLAWIFEEHHIEHHKHHRYDINVDLPIYFHLIISSPFLLLLALFYPIGLIPFVLTLVHHSIYWTKLHRAAHDLEHNWTEKLGNFERMKQHHLFHHDAPSKNFGVVYPWTDKFFGTSL